MVAQDAILGPRIADDFKGVGWVIFCPPPKIEIRTAEVGQKVTHHSLGEDGRGVMGNLPPTSDRFRPDGRGWATNYPSYGLRWNRF